MQPIKAGPFQASNSPVVRIGPLSFLSPLECAQSVFRACKRLSVGGYNWDHLKVVPLELKDDGLRVLSNDFQDCGCFVGSFMYVPLRNEKVQGISIENSAHLCAFPNKPVLFESMYSPATVKTYGLTDEGLKIQSSLSIENPPPNNSSVSISDLYCEEERKDRKDKRVVRKLQLVGFKYISICNQTKSGTWQNVRQAHASNLALVSQSIGQVLCSADGVQGLSYLYYDLANACNRLDMAPDLIEALDSLQNIKPDGSKQIMFVLNKKLIMTEKRGHMLAHKWSWQPEELPRFNIKTTDNNWLVTAQMILTMRRKTTIAKTYVLNARNGETVFTFESNSYIQFWLKRNVMFYETADHALHILKPVRQLDKRIKYVTAQLLPADKNPIETLVYRMFLPLFRTGAEHKLFVFRKTPQDPSKMQ